MSCIDCLFVAISGSSMPILLSTLSLEANLSSVLFSEAVALPNEISLGFEEESLIF